MPKSKQLKLYPLFRRPSEVSSVDHVKNDTGNAIDVDSDSDEDNIPLTSLLLSRPTPSQDSNGIERNRKPSGAKSGLKALKGQKKNEKKRLASAVSASAHCDNTENKNPRFNAPATDCKQKEIKTRVEESFAPSKKMSKHTKIGRKATVQATITAAIASANDHTKKPAQTKRAADSDNPDGEREIKLETLLKSEINKNSAPLSSKTLPTNHCSSDEKHKNGSRWKVGVPLFSQSTMDFVASEGGDSKEPFRKNIVHTLNRRTTHGGCLVQGPLRRHYSPSSKARMEQNRRSSLPLSSSWPTKLKIPSWISLEQPLTGNTASSIGGNIDHMAWDAMGVLLAVSSDRTIRIYDWDMLRAADIRGRSDRARNTNDHTEFKIPPIVNFQLPHPVSSLVWNPFEMDELAVGFRVSGQTIIYNVDRVARWIAKDPSRYNRRPLPHSTHQSIVLQRVTGSIGDILFLDADNMLIAVGNTLFRWKRNLEKLRRLKQRQPNGAFASGILVWRYQPPSPVTSMALIGSNMVIVGTNRGHLLLIDWTKRTKVTLSFSHEHRPKVLQSWLPHERLKATHEDKGLRNRMGIVKLRVESSNQSCTVGKKNWGRCRVLWVTLSGWLLSTILESAVRISEPCLVHSASPKVMYTNSDGIPITTDKRSWSLPYNPIGVDMSNQHSACWVGVPGVTRKLSHHDKFVLDSQPSTVVSKRRSLMVHGIGDKIRNIPLPGIVKGLPQSIAVHPSFEWILVGEGKRLHVMVGSGRANTNG